MASNGKPVTSFMPDGDADPSKAASQAPVGGLTGFGFSLKEIAPKPSKGSSAKTEAPVIEWPADVVAMAKRLGITLPEKEPGRGKSPAGSLICLPKGSPHAGAVKVPTVASLKRRDGAAVWASWLAYGADGQCPALAEGKPLPLISVFRSLIGANLDGAAFKILWRGSGDRTSILGQLACHTGKPITLTLSGNFPVTVPVPTRKV